jgi:uncharacterized protein
LIIIVQNGGAEMKLELSFSREELASFCKEHGINRMAVFGSILRDDFRPDSDVDILAEFDPLNIPTLFDMVEMEQELSRFFSGRKVDLRTPEDLSRYFRHQVVSEAEVLYAGE